MTTILYEDGQFQTEDGICFEDQKKVKTLIVHQNFGDYDIKRFNIDNSSVNHLFDSKDTYSIREKMEVVDQQRYYHERDLTWTIWFDKGRYKLSDNDQVESRKVARIVEEKEESEEHDNLNPMSTPEQR